MAEPPEEERLAAPAACELCEERFWERRVYHCARCSHTLRHAGAEEASVGAELAALRTRVQNSLKSEAGAAGEAKRRERVREMRHEVERRRRELFERRQRKEAAGRRLAVLRLEAEHAARVLAERKTRLDEARQWLETARQTAPLENELRAKKQELVAQLFGLLPVFPTLQGTMRVVNFETPKDEAYHLMDMDECAAITGYFVKLSALLGRYLEVSLPNRLSLDQHRWMIRARGSPTTGEPIPPVPLNPRVAGMDAYRVGLTLLQQNVVRLCFDQGISIRPGHEHELSQNLHRLITFSGLGSDGPFPRRLRLPEEQLSEEDFVMVKNDAAKE